jgi:hypothetical protein
MRRASDLARDYYGISRPPSAAASYSYSDQPEASTSTSNALMPYSRAAALERSIGISRASTGTRHRSQENYGNRRDLSSDFGRLSIGPQELTSDIPELTSNIQKLTSDMLVPKDAPCYGHWGYVFVFIDEAYKRSFSRNRTEREREEKEIREMNKRKIIDLIAPYVDELYTTILDVRIALGGSAPRSRYLHATTPLEKAARIYQGIDWVSKNKIELFKEIKNKLHEIALDNDRKSGGRSRDRPSEFERLSVGPRELTSNMLVPQERSLYYYDWRDVFVSASEEKIIGLITPHIDRLYTILGFDGCATPQEKAKHMYQTISQGSRNTFQTYLIEEIRRDLHLIACYKNIHVFDDDIKSGKRFRDILRSISEENIDHQSFYSIHNYSLLGENAGFGGALASEFVEAMAPFVDKIFQNIKFKNVNKYVELVNKISEFLAANPNSFGETQNPFDKAQSLYDKLVDLNYENDVNKRMTTRQIIQLLKRSAGIA